MRTLHSLALFGGLASGAALAAETKFDLYGGQAFDTTVDGFVTMENPTREEAAQLDADWQPAAYLTITAYWDQRFHDSVMAAIQEGNTLNHLDGQGRVQFRLGCFDGKTIQNDEFVIPSQNELLASNPSDPVTVTLQFKKQIENWDSMCVSFADGLRVVPTTGTRGSH